MTMDEKEAQAFAELAKLSINEEVREEASAVVKAPGVDKENINVVFIGHVGTKSLCDAP